MEKRRFFHNNQKVLTNRATVRQQRQLWSATGKNWKVQNKIGKTNASELWVCAVSHAKSSYWRDSHKLAGCVENWIKYKHADKDFKLPWLQFHSFIT